MSTLNKNQIIPLEITALTTEGLGLGRFENIVVFVSNSAPGDLLSVKIVKVLRSHSYGIIEEIITPSPNRVENDCPSFPRCGGCKLRHISYESEVMEKNEFVKQNLKKIGKVDIDLEAPTPSPMSSYYRNKAQYPVGMVDGKVSVGFYASRSHRLIPMTDCKIQPEVFSEITDFVCAFLQKNNISVYDEENHNGLVRHICIRSNEDQTEIMLTLVINGSKLPMQSEFVSELTSNYPQIATVILSHNTQKTNVVMGKTETIIHGDGFITDTLAGIKLRLSSNSFYQVNKAATELLYAKAREYANPSKEDTLLDLYCGIGSIGLAMANDLGSVVGVEIAPQAVEDAKVNAELNGITNTRFICADAGTAACQLANDGLLPDIIVVDPPRKGLDAETISAICVINPKRVVYVSCNSSTMSRDVELLSQSGFLVKKASAFDLFPRTPHIESVVLIENSKR